MSRQRRWLADRLSRMGGRIFTWLSRWEQEDISKQDSSRLGSSKLTGWLKLGLLGVFVSVITALTAQEVETHVMCYDVAYFPDIYLTEIEATPNPTEGAEEVTVTARATVSEYGGQKEKSLIESVFLVIDADTVTHQMEPVDGKWDSYDEKVQVKIVVPDCEPCTTMLRVLRVLRVTATAGDLTPETGSIYLIVTGAGEEGNDTPCSTPETKVAPKEKTEE